MLVKYHSMGSIHLRFPVAGLWSLSVEYEGQVYTKTIEVHGQRGKQAKLQSKLAAEALNTGQGLMEDLDSEESTSAEGEASSGSVSSTPRSTRPSNRTGRHMPTVESPEGLYQATGMITLSGSAASATRGPPLMHQQANFQSGQPFQQQQSQSQYSANQPPFPLQPLSNMGYPGDSKGYSSDAKGDFNSFDMYNSSVPMFVPNGHSNPSGIHGSYDPYTQLSSSPNSSSEMMMMAEATPEGSTFAYNDMGQYGSASHMKHQEAEMHYIQPDAVYYPIPPAVDDIFDSGPSSPSVDSSDSSTPVFSNGYPFLSRIIPNSTSEVVSLGQECALLGQNFVYTDSDSSSIWFTLQANKAKVKAPVQRSTSTTHVATIPPLSYFGVSYSMEPLMAIVELYQYSMLVPCEQQFHYLSTSGQLNGGSSRISVSDHSSGTMSFNGPRQGSNFGSNFGAQSSGSGDASYGTNYFSPAGTAYAKDAEVPAPSFFFNAGVPLLNTLTVDNNLEDIVALVAKGADVNQADIWGITPLHLAIFFGRREISNYLLGLSVEKSVQTEDINGDTPLDLVIRHWNPEIRGLYDVMVSLLRDPSQTVSPSEGTPRTDGILSRRPPSMTNLPPPRKPSFLSKKDSQAPPTKALSKDVPFKLEGETLLVTRPEFWTELHLAIQKISAESTADGPSSEEEKKLLDQWSQVNKVKHVISSELNLTEFPSIPVMAFPVVERLDFSGNSLRFLPNDWSKFKTLSSLDVSRNLIDILPGSLASLPALSSFSCADNPLRLLPASLALRPRNSPTSASTGSSSSSGPLPTKPTSPPAKEQAWNRTALFKYLRDTASGADSEISDSKVRINVLGEQYTDRRLLQKTLQVDFSSFVTRLRYRVPNINASDEVSVEDVNGKFSSSDSSFETWTAGVRHSDFASQALITPLSIQVVVFSLLRPEAKELERLQYWLNAIALRAPMSPVLIVACGSDASNSSRDAASLIERVGAMTSSIISSAMFNAAEDLITVSFSNGDGIDALKKRFNDLASRHGLCSRTFPKPIAQLMQAILAVKDTRWFLSKRELTELALQFGIEMADGWKEDGASAPASNAANLPTFSAIVQFLSNLGGLAHFPDGTERLADIVFTDPQRLCHALTNFAARHKRLIKDGVLHLSDCEPQFVSILNGLPPIASEVTTSHGPSGSPPQSPTNSLQRGGPSPGSVSPPQSGSPPADSPAPIEAALHELAIRPVVSVRNSKGYLTSPLKAPVRSSSNPLASPLIGRPRIDDRILADLLVLFGDAIRLPQEDAVLIPRLLPENISDDLLLQYWTQGLSHSFERVYHFNGPAIPKRLMNGLIAQLYSDHRLEVCLHWSRGLVIRYGTERVRISSPALNILHLHVAGEMPSRLLPMIVELVDCAIAAFASPQALAQVLVPTANMSSASTTLRLEEILETLCEGEAQITRGRTTLRIGMVAPDLCLLEMQPLEVEEDVLSIRSSDLSVSEALDAALKEAIKSASLPSGSAVPMASLEHADLVFVPTDAKTVWNGTLRGADVQIAYFHRPVAASAFRTKEDYLAAVSASYARGLRACCAEARLLNSLQHPNVVPVKGFNLAAQLLATEGSSFGTLSSVLQRVASGTIAEPFSAELKLRMMMELAQAVAWMHSNHVAHGALNADAVLVTSLDVNAQHVHIKLGNFHNAKRLFAGAANPEEKKDIRELAALFSQIWSVTSASASDDTAPTTISSDSSSEDVPAVVVAASAAAPQLDSDVAELIASCNASDEPIGIAEMLQHLEYLFAVNNWKLSGASWRHMSGALSPSYNGPSHSYWSLDKSARFLEFNEREIASISSIVRASNGHIWVATASGYAHVWNPQAPANAARTVIQTYSVDTRQSRRRINALMTSGSYVWCITDGSICVYSNDGQLVKSITHKQSLCITKYSSPSVRGSEPSSSMVYIGGAHGEISVWDSTTFQCTLGVVLENRLPITAIAVDAHYLWIGVGVSRRVCHVVVLNKHTLNEICRFQAHEDLISSIVVVDDSHIWTSSFGGKINIWQFNAESDNKVSVRLEKSLLTHRRAILKMTAGPRASDGSVSKVYASDNNGIFVWDTKQTQIIDKHLLGRHRGAIGALESIDSNSFISASVEDGCVCLWKRNMPPQ